MGGGGGGSTGMTSYPDYMQEKHNVWLAQVNQAMVETRAWNPYEHGAAAYNPTTELSGVTTAIQDVADNMWAFAPGTKWGDSVTTVEGRAVNAVYTYAKTGIDNLNAFISTLSGVTDWNTAYDAAVLRVEDSDYTAVVDALEEYRVLLTAFIASDYWTTAATVVDAKVETIISDTDATADALAYAAILESDITNRVLPRFQSGLRDVNAAMSSAFVLGEAIIWSMSDRDVAKYLAGLKEKLAIQKTEVFRHGMDQVVKLQSDKLSHHINISSSKLALFAKKNELTIAGANEMLKQITVKLDSLKAVTTSSSQLYGTYSENLSKAYGDIFHAEMQKITFLKEILHYIIEANRINIVAKKEYNSEGLAIADNAMTWNLKTFQYGNNVLASIGAGVAMNESNAASKTTTAIGGALSGAASGAYIGGSASSWSGPYAVIGGAVGAVVGGIGGYLSGK